MENEGTSVVQITLDGGFLINLYIFLYLINQ